MIAESLILINLQIAYTILIPANIYVLLKFLVQFEI